MASNPLYPLQTNYQTGEQYLRLDHPYTHIIVTPPRESDVGPSVSIMNDPRVCHWMGIGGPIDPYTSEQATRWLERVKTNSDSILRNLANATDSELKLVDGCPVRHIREVKEDGTEVYIGDIGIERASWREITNKIERKQLLEENAARKPGDPEIVWQIGGEQIGFTQQRTDHDRFQIISRQVTMVKA